MYSQNGRLCRHLVALLFQPGLPGGISSARPLPWPPSPAFSPFPSPRWALRSASRQLDLGHCPLSPGPPTRYSRRARRPHGSVMGVLSFGFFLACFLATINLWRTQYREMMIARINEIAAQNPDPQAQQMTQWFATPHGFIFLTAIGMGTILLAFLVIGMGSGALAVALGKARNRP